MTTKETIDKLIEKYDSKYQKLESQRTPFNMYDLEHAFILGQQASITLFLTDLTDFKNTLK